MPLARHRDLLRAFVLLNLTPELDAHHLLHIGYLVLFLEELEFLELIRDFVPLGLQIEGNYLLKLLFIVKYLYVMISDFSVIPCEDPFFDHIHFLIQFFVHFSLLPWDNEWIFVQLNLVLVIVFPEVNVVFSVVLDHIPLMEGVLECDYKRRIVFCGVWRH